MTTYEKLWSQFDYYKACYERLDSFYWDNLDYDTAGNICIPEYAKTELRRLYKEYKMECATTLSLISDYSSGIFNLYEENIHLMRRDIADYDARLSKMLKEIL